MSQIPDRLYFRIGDVAEIAGVKPYVLRYWESEFSVISPQKSNSGQRVYKRTDVETILMIKHLLYAERYSIEGARKRLKELRKAGELKAAVQEKTLPPADEKARAEKAKKLKALSRELQDLIRTPIREIFKY